MDINNYSFNYNNLGGNRMGISLWECIIKDNINNVSFGTKFQHPSHQPNNAAVFENFKNKEIFKQHWWIEAENVIEVKKEEIKVVPDEKIELTTEIPPEIKIDTPPESVIFES